MRSEKEKARRSAAESGTMIVWGSGLSWVVRWKFQKDYKMEILKVSESDATMDKNLDNLKD